MCSTGTPLMCSTGTPLTEFFRDWGSWTLFSASCKSVFPSLTKCLSTQLVSEIMRNDSKLKRAADQEQINSKLVWAGEVATVALIEMRRIETLRFQGWRLFGKQRSAKRHSHKNEQKLTSVFVFMMVMMMMVQYHHHHMILILILIIILHCEFNCEMLTTCVSGPSCNTGFDIRFQFDHLPVRLTYWSLWRPSHCNVVGK